VLNSCRIWSPTEPYTPPPLYTLYTSTYCIYSILLTHKDGGGGGGELNLTYLFTWCVVPRGPGRASLGNVRSGMSRSHLFWIRQLSRLAAWSIWAALWVRYMDLKLSLLSTLFMSAGIRFQSSITRILKKFLLGSSLPCFTFRLYGSAVLLVALSPFSAFSNQVV
jgi:hypothetical protein